MASRAKLLVHGGAGAVRRDMTPRREAACRAALERALEAGRAVLAGGGAAVDAVVAAVTVLEDSPLFNAGRGAAPNAEGEYELDAAVMDGAARRAGGVAAVRRTRNPVLAAREVMASTAHVLLAGAAADRFARSRGLELVPNAYFAARSEAPGPGTVGAVALDREGNLAAATSTGGLKGKLPGRVGDSPLVGAGTYADNATCAVSGTGLGEAFIRAVLAYDVAARIKYRGEPLALAARRSLAGVARLGGRGGLIAIDRRGRTTAAFNSEGMFRGLVGLNGRPRVAID